MTDSRPKNAHHPASALADYLQDLLSPVEDFDSSIHNTIDNPVGNAEDSSAVGQPIARISESPKAEEAGYAVAPARAAKKSARAGADWAEPPLLDLRAYAPRIAVHPETIAGQDIVSNPDSVLTPTKALAEPGDDLGLKVPVRVPTVEEPGAPSQTESPQIDTPEVPRGRWIEGKPEWAQQPFDCLLFTVSGLKLAVPLVLLGAVHPLDQELTPLVGRPRWFMGLLRRGNRNTRVVDTAQWVMPDRYRLDGKGDYGFVIRLDDSEWGLACDAVAQSFRLKPEEVKWRSEDSRRPWLAGTVKSQMCALLDVGEFARMLARAEKTQKLDLEQ